jgi:hypothetical protein
MERPVVQCNPLTLTGNAVYVQCFQAKVILDRVKELVIFLGRSPTVLILYLDSTLLMLLKMGPRKGKKATDVRSSPDVPSLPGGLKAQRISPSL